MRKFSKIESELLLKEELTVGIDEVGRGSLIGPVVACAFQLDSIIKNIELNDSKMLSENKRISKVLAITIPDEINSFNSKEINEICDFHSIKCEKVNNINDALKYFRSNQEKIYLITGSLYLIGKIRRKLL